jgi:predicted ATPase
MSNTIGERAFMITIISSEDNKAGSRELTRQLNRLPDSCGYDRPEQGLHPIHHADLADAWITQAQEAQDVFVFTHSDIAILRLIRRIEEGKVLPGHVRFMVYATSYDEPEFVEVPIVMDEQGGFEFGQNWPCKSGFFECRAKELFY